MSVLQEWRKDSFLISTSQALLQPDVINDAFESDYMYWTRRLSPTTLQKMLESSLCFGVYIASDDPATPGPVQIGLARLVTDYVSLAYLTDVFILPSYQGKGLGKWLMKCINEAVTEWPDLRAVLLFAGGAHAEHATKFYNDMLGAEVFDPVKEGDPDMKLLCRFGPGSAFR
ncbi:hypothetical protein B0H17DRAFT_983429 [Mycena rosella]|uniref:N-acetyltransferase domain-containing protein n=1 Tax=Mycena rosella TaxID=1033263 RepID=A0AAD7GGG6_MYCRO|nr:hypothetical protein B0H17DRAFT_983429 [Mycena rosella]